ncbi:MAG: tetratricopeptide repeat protein [Gemmatimonadota bacterium]
MPEKRQFPRRVNVAFAFLVVLPFGLLGCGGSDVPAPEAGGDGSLELVSPLGRELHSQTETQGRILAADAALAEDPDNVDLLIAAGIARAGVWQYNDAIAMYDRAAQLAPENPWVFRHRGHRYISTRRFVDAVADLERAAALDSLSFDILYHLGLARYLAGDFDGAAREYRRCFRHATTPALLELEASGELGEGYRSCMSLAVDDDTRVAITDWLYRAQRRSGHHEEAAQLLESVTEGMDVSDNLSYYQALLFYKGLRTEEEILDRSLLSGNQLQTMGYGVGNWHLVEGDTARAHALFREIVEGEEWPAFGFIAAETELARAR